MELMSGGHGASGETPALKNDRQIAQRGNAASTDNKKQPRMDANKDINSCQFASIRGYERNPCGSATLRNLPIIPSMRASWLLIYRRVAMC
jgi:hypothetical protein